MSRAPDPVNRRDVLVLGLLALLILGAGLGLRDGWPADEPRFAMIARDMVWTGDWIFPRRAGELYADKPPMFLWAIALFYKLLGNLRVAFLLPSLLGGLGTLALVYDLARRLWNAETAKLAALALLFTVQFTLQARTAQIDALLVLWTTLAIYGFCRHLLLGPAPRWFVTAWAAMGLGVITKGVGFLPLLLLVPYGYARWRQWPSAVNKLGVAPLLLGALAFVGMIALWAVPMLIAVAHSPDPALHQYRDNILFHQTVDRYADPWMHLKPVYYFFVNVIPIYWQPLVLLLPWLVPAWRARLRERDLPTLMFLSFAVMVLLFFSGSPAKRTMYILPVVPALALAAAPLLREIWNRAAVQRTGWGFAMLLAIGAIGEAVWFGWIQAAQGQALASDLDANPYPMLLALGAVALTSALALRPRRGGLAVLVTLTVAWVLYGFWAAPVFNPARSGSALMAAAAEQLDPKDEIAMINFREQMTLQADRPVVQFGYHTDNAVERAQAVRWVREKPNRVVMVTEREAGKCFDPARAVPLKRWRSTRWSLLRADAVRDPLPEDCQLKVPPLTFQSLARPPAS